MNESWSKLIKMDDNELQKDEIQYIDLRSIRPNPFQPRKVFDPEKVSELAQSIKTYGLLQPIILRKCNENFQIVAGERRFMACRDLGWTSISAIVRELTDSAMATIALIENLQRENLHFLEEAAGYQKLLDDFNLTQEVLAQRLGKSQSTIANKIRLLKLPARIREFLYQQELSERHARALLKLRDEESQLRVYHEICNLGMTVKQAERRVDELLRKQSEQGGGKKKVIIRDIRIFLNTLRQAVSILEKAGLKPVMSEKDCVDFLEVTISLPKRRKNA